MDSEKYFIYKGTGGLFHNLSGLAESIELAIKHNAILIIDMQSHRIFGGKFSDYFTINNDKLKYYDDYENIPHELIEDIKDKQASNFGYMKKQYTINHGQQLNILYGCGKWKTRYSGELDAYAHFEKHLLGTVSHHPIQDIKVSNLIFNKIKSENNIDKKYLSVHFRNTDLKRLSFLNDESLFFDKIKTTLKTYDIDTVYIASDDSAFYDNFSKMFKHIKMIRKTHPPAGIENLHYTAPDSKKQMYECLQDVYNILNSTMFIPSLNSGLSIRIIDMINNKYTIFPGVISKTKILQFEQLKPYKVRFKRF